MPTSVFVIADDDARLDFANGTVWPVSVNRTETGDVYRHEGTRDWVRVTAEGRSVSGCIWRVGR